MAQKKVVELELKADSFKEALSEAKSELKKSADETARLSREQSKLGKASKRANAIMTKGVKKATQSLNKLIKSNPKLVRGFKAAGKAAKRVGTMARSGARLAAKGFKMAGAAMKTAFAATGILAIIGGLAGILQRSQKVRDIMDKVGRTIGIMVDGAIEAVSGLVERFGGFSNILATIKEKVASAFTLDGLKNFGKMIKDNIIERVNSAIEMFGFLASAVKKVFSGDFSGALDDVKEAGKELIDVTTGVDGTLDKVAETVTKGTKALVSYTKESYKAANSIVNLQKRAGQLEKEYEGLKSTMEEQLEIEKSIADNSTLGFEARIEANERMNETVQEGMESMLENLNDQLAAQEAILAVQEDDQEALDKKAEILSKIDTLNKDTAALNTQNELRGDALVLEQGIARVQQDSLETQISLRRKLLGETTKISRNIFDSIEQQKEAAKIEKDIAIQVSKEKFEINDLRLQNEKDILIKHGVFTGKVEEEWRARELQNLNNYNQERTDASAEADATIAILDDAAAQSKIQLGRDTTLQLADFIDTLEFKNEKAAKRAFMISKALRMGEAVVGTAKNIVDAGTNPILIAQAVAMGATQIATIAKTKFGGGGSAPTAGGAGGSTAPVAGSLGRSERQGSNLVEDINRTPVRSYVVASDVNSQAELERKRTDRATL